MPCKLIFDLAENPQNWNKLVVYKKTENDEDEDKVELYIVKACPGRLANVFMIMDQVKIARLQIDILFKWLATFRDCKRSFVITPDFEQVMCDTFDGIRIQTSPYDENRNLHLIEEEVETLLRLEADIRKLFHEGIDASDCACGVESAFFLMPCGRF